MSLPIKYKDQSANDLTLRIAEELTDVSPFNILGEESMQVAGYKFRLGILGASHFLSLQKGSLALTEILSCIPWQVSCDAGLFLGPLERTVQCGIEFKFKDNVQYRLDASIQVLSKVMDSVASLEKNISQRRGNCIGLSYVFPGSPKDFTDPKTLVFGEFVAGRMNVQTAHLYPNEDLVALTTTTIW